MSSSSRRLGTRALPAWIVAAASVLPALLALVAARWDRPTVGPDAVSYIAVADSLRAGSGLGFFLEDPLTTWPPGWPGLLALGGAVTGWRGDLVALALNALLLCGVVLVGSMLGRRVLERRSVLYAQLAGLAVSPLLIGLAIIVQTEIAFVLGAAVVLLWVLVGIERDRPAFFAAAGAVLAVCFYIRYQAFYAVPIVAGWLGLRSWLATRSLGRAAADVCWLAVPAVLPSAVWMVRNLSVSDTIMGPRFPSDVGPVENVAAAFRTFTKFLTSVPEGPAVPMTLLGVLAAGFMVVTLVLTGRDRRNSAGQDGSGGRWWWREGVAAFQRPVGLLVTFVVGFTALMAASRSVVGFDDLDIRLLAPCAVPTAILFLRWVEVVLLDSGGWAWLGKAAIGVWLGAQVVVTLLLLGPANSVLGDSGYNAPRAVAASSSPVIDLLPDDCILYSNNAGDLYRTKVEARLSPRIVEYKSSQRTDDLEELVEAVEGGEKACLIWFEYTEDDEVHSREALSEVLVLDKVGSGDEVTVYTIEPRSP